MPSKLPQQDPYDLLGVPFQASKAEISKAYRKLALKLHPDKQQKASPQEAEEIAKKFHDVKEARSFLLDDEHAEARRKYDAKRESDRLRQQTEMLREKNMSERRKKLQKELKEKEALAVRQREKNEKARQNRKEADIVDQLRREGKRKREEYAERDVLQKEVDDEAVIRDKARSDKKIEKEKLERRQVRLKWNRKKMKPSPSEDSLAKLLSEKFGSVETVELLARKGNQALVTFVNQSSCKSCVEFYATSSVMRARYVGKRKDEEDSNTEKQVEKSATEGVHHGLVNESLEERRMRQAVERERLLRELEKEDDDEDKKSSSKSRHGTEGIAKKNKESKKRRHGSSKKESLFPLQFPDSVDYKDLLPINALEKFESYVLKNLMTQDKITAMQVTIASTDRQDGKMLS